MREHMPSATAAAVALARGIATLPARQSAPAPDPLAADLLPPVVGRLLRRLAPWAERAPAISVALRLGMLGLVDHVALRTAAIDEALAEACGAEPVQLVLLGAGLDARAYRLDALAGVDVFEVDHPATQRNKRHRAAGLVARAATVTHVAVDFAREDLGERLADHGHSLARPTFWIWEGVHMYLPAAASHASLESMARRSAPGSRLAMTYGTLHDRAWIARLRRPIEASFRILGEPLVGLAPTADVHRTLEDTGWSVRQDTGPRDWRVRFGYGFEPLLLIDERLAVAERA